MPADTPSPSPLNSEERAKFERVAQILAANPSPSGLDGYGGWAIGFLRALALADSMAARVSDLEAERDGLRDALEVALALCPPAPEDKKESGREPGHPVYGWQTE